MKHDPTNLPLDTDIRKGDVVLCVKGGPITTLGSPPKEGYPKAGAFYTVETVQVFKFVDGEKLALTLVDGPMNITCRTWSAQRFIKVTPPSSLANDLYAFPKEEENV